MDKQTLPALSAAERVAAAGRRPRGSGGGPPLPGRPEAADPRIAQTTRQLLATRREQRGLRAAWDAARGAGMRTPELETLQSHGDDLTQSAVAALLHYSPRQYRDWESGRVPVPVRMLGPLALLLGLDEQEVRWLRLISAPVPAASGGAEMAPPEVRALVHCVAAPAYLATAAWEIVEASPAYWQLFDWCPGERSVARAVLLRPQARAVLVEWERDWAGPLLDVIWTTYQVRRGDDALALLVEELLEDAGVRALWERRQAAGPRIRFHQVRGDPLQLNHPVHGLVRVTPLVATPEAVASAGMRLVTLLPERALTGCAAVPDSVT